MTPSQASLPLVGEHFAAATLYLVAGAVGLVWIAPELSAGLFLSPHVAGITHLFTLGWITTSMLGALYQLLPVALGSPIRWPRLAHGSFWTFAPGAGLFACGVARGSTGLHHAGIGLIAIGLTLAITNVASALRRTITRDVTWTAITVAFLFLIATFALGVALVHNIHSGFLMNARVLVLSTHLHVALVGWALIMIAGVSHRLLPMFLLAHGASTGWTARAIGAWTVGVVLLAVGLNGPLAVAGWTGVAALEVGVLCFAIQARAFYRARVRKRVDATMYFVAAAIALLVASAALGPFVMWWGPSAPRVATAYVILGLLGGVVVYVVAMYYKIVPLLAWTVRYGDRAGTSGVPTVAQTYSARLALTQLAIMPTAVAGTALAVLANSTRGVRFGATLFLVGVLVFVIQLARVTFGQPIGVLT